MRAFRACVCVCVMTNRDAFDQKVLPDHANASARGSERRGEMSVWDWNVCVHYAYEPLS